MLVANAYTNAALVFQLGIITVLLAMLLGSVWRLQTIVEIWRRQTIVENVCKTRELKDGEEDCAEEEEDQKKDKP